MATLRDIKRRIKAVHSTRQITKAMKMVAASKLRKVQSRMLELRPYSDKMASVIAGLSTAADLDSNPLLAVREPKSVEVLVLTSDRGLCGAFNTNILKAASAHIKELGLQEAQTVAGGPVGVEISTIGKKALEYYKRRKVGLRRSWTGLSGSLGFHNAAEVAGDIIKRYSDGETDGVYLVYNSFRNVATHEVTVTRLLPTKAPEPEEGAAELRADYIYEPSEQALFERLLPKNVEIQIYRALLESQASEEAARMTTMENATQSATEMIDGLTLKYNKARQASITAELMDIVGGVEALKS